MNPPSSTNPGDDTAAREIVSTRLIQASPEAIFAAFTAPDRLARWWGPSGFSNAFEVFEFKPGGTWRFVMIGPDGKRYPNESRFIEVQPAARIVLQHLSAPHFTMTITLRPQGPHCVIHWRMLFETAAVRDQVAVYAIPANEQNFDRLQAELARVG